MKIGVHRERLSLDCGRTAPAVPDCGFRTPAAARKEPNLPTRSLPRTRETSLFTGMRRRGESWLPACAGVSGIWMVRPRQGVKANPSSRFEGEGGAGSFQRHIGPPSRAADGRGDGWGDGGLRRGAPNPPYTSALWIRRGWRAPERHRSSYIFQAPSRRPPRRFWASDIRAPEREEGGTAAHRLFRHDHPTPHIAVRGLSSPPLRSAWS
jgi:hypothetical protein